MKYRIVIFGIIVLISYVWWHEILFFIRFQQQELYLEFINEVDCDWEECTAFKVLSGSSCNFRREVCFLEFTDSTIWIGERYELYTQGRSDGSNLRKIKLRGYMSRYTVNREECGCSGANIFLVIADN